MTDTTRRAYRLAYDGSGYRGFQRQPQVSTVSDAIIDALVALDVASGVPPGYTAAGRTDAGVSAVAQTVAFDAPDWVTPAALNGELPADVRAWASAGVSENFHATHDATRREYVYHLRAPCADCHRASDAMEQLSGQHDFHNLTPDAEGTIRELTGRVDRDSEFLVITVRAGGFARQLVRRLVTVVKRVGTGVADRDLVDAALSPDPLVGPEGIPPAPPEPLVLTAVEYPGVTFQIDPDAVSSGQAVFSERRTHLAARARVAGQLVAEIGDDDEPSSTTAGEKGP